MGRHIKINRVVFFDGVCNLCNFSVQFIIARDTKKIFRFAPIQSDYARKHLHNEVINEFQPDSILLLDGKKIFRKSTAILNIFRSLDKGWPLFYVFIIVPPVIRDSIYDLIARKRYKWFGKRDECMVPSNDVMDRFEK